MLSVEECRKFLAKYHLSDEEIKQFRDSWYVIINSIIDHELEVQYENEKMQKQNKN